jgi:hypothetical protein
MLRLHPRPRGKMRLFVLGVVVAIAASVALSPTAAAAVTTCSTLGAVSGATNINYGTCATDQNGGVGSVAFSADGTRMTLSAKTRQGDQQVAGFWGSNGPISVAATLICVQMDVSELRLKGGGEVQEQLSLSYNGVTHAPLTWSVTSTGLQDPYCASVPAGATNVWWQLTTLAGGSKPASQARISQTAVSVRYSSTS